MGPPALKRVLARLKHAPRTRLWIGALAVLAALGAAALGVAWIVTAPRPAFTKATVPDGGDAARGALVFAAGDCASCHASPGQSDRLQLGGGLALSSPYGTFRVPNISQDKSDGIGLWSTADLANALLSGVSPHGEHYYPAFPYPSYAKMTVADVVDLMAYLRTLPAVTGKPPEHQLNPIYQVRRFVGFWKLLYFDRTPITDDPNRDSQWNRGRYLVEGLGHCAECHSPRGVFGAIEESRRYAGAVDPEGTGFIPNITPGRIGHWTEADIAEMLKSGRTPDHGRVGSSMTEVVVNTAQLPQSDRDAIAAYVKSLPARETERP